MISLLKAVKKPNAYYQSKPCREELYSIISDLETLLESAHREIEMLKSPEINLSDVSIRDK